MTGVVRATFELEPAGSAAALAVEESTGLPGAAGLDDVLGRVVSEADGRAVVEFPVSNWGRNVAMLVSSVVAGEAMETSAFTRCRLVDLELPAGLLPGPALGARGGVGVGVIVKPSLGLRPHEVADVAATASAAGAVLVKDDELMGDPSWCPLAERVRAVVPRLEGHTTYCVNVTGPTATLLDRARLAVDLGATGLMVNAFAQGADAVLALRDAGLGVPILAHRVGAGPMTRNDRFGVAPAVLASLLRWCGADYLLAGAYGGKLFDSDDDVDAQIDAARRPWHGMPAATAVLGGGVGPENAKALADRAGGDGVLLLLGSAAYRYEGGLAAAVRATVEAVT